MTISYQNKRADFNAFLEYQVQMRSKPAYWLSRFVFPVVLVLLAVVLAGLVWRYGARLSQRHNQINFLCIILCLTLSRWWSLYQALNFWLLQRQSGFGASITIELREDGVHLRHAMGENLIFWQAFYRVDRNRHYLFLFLNVRSALIIPNSVFPSATEANAFFHFAQAHWQFANDSVQPPPLAAP